MTIPIDPDPVAVSRFGLDLRRYGLTAVIAIVPAGRSAGKEIQMDDRRQLTPIEDPVCGMTLEPDQARARGLAITFGGTEYAATM